MSLTRGKESIHEAKVAHGMLASEHVLLNTDGHVVLASFSGAARQERSAPSRNRARIMPHCAAPERFRNTGATPAADFWSLGCLIYEMLTG
jgi:serine/threonine protein kinase